MTPSWKLAFRNLSRNRRRNVTTGLALALGYAGALLLSGYSTRMERLIRTSSVYLQHFGHLAVYARGGLVKAVAKPAAYTLPRDAQDSIVAALRLDRRVELVGRYLRGEGLAGNGCKTFPFVALGIELDVERKLLTHPQVLEVAPDLAKPVEGRSLPDAEGEENPVAVAVGLGRHRLRKPPAAGPRDVAPRIAQALDCSAPSTKIGSDPYVQLAARTLDGSFGATDVRLVSYFQAGTSVQDRSALIAGLDVLQPLYETDRVTYVAAFLRDYREAHAVARDVRAKLAASGLAVDVYPYDDREANPYYVGTMSMIGAVVTFIGVLVANVVGLSVLNAMTLAVLERTREIGTLRSLGFTRRQLLGLFLREAAALTAISIGAGLVLALASAGAVRAAHLRFQPPGVGGTIGLDVMPAPAACAVLAVLFVVLSLSATWMAVRRRLRERVASLVVEVAA